VPSLLRKKELFLLDLGMECTIEAVFVSGCPVVADTALVVILAQGIELGEPGNDLAFVARGPVLVQVLCITART